MKFYELTVDAVFTWHSKTYTKAAMGCAADENRLGYAFPGIVEVQSEGPLLPQTLRPSGIHEFYNSATGWGLPLPRPDFGFGL
jgi:hypothetical protein